jgi:hypothetical protein
MSPGCTSGPFPSRLSPFLFFPDQPRSLGVPNFHQGAPLKKSIWASAPPKLQFTNVLKVAQSTWLRQHQGRSQILEVRHM